MKNTLLNLPNHATSNPRAADTVPVHLSMRVVHDLDLLLPYEDINVAIISVIAHALWANQHVRLYALVVLANHVDFILEGPRREVAKFASACKRNITVGLRQHGCPVKGALFLGNVITRLPSHDNQVRALGYLLGRGVEEGMFRRPTDWPGVHCVRALTFGEGLWGASPFAPYSEIHFAPLPAWEHLDASMRHRAAQTLAHEVVTRGVVANPTIGLVRNERAFADALMRRFAGSEAGLRLVA